MNCRMQFLRYCLCAITGPVHSICIDQRRTSLPSHCINCHVAGEFCMIDYQEWYLPMKYGSASSTRWDKTVCLAAALLLHGIFLTVLWRSHSIPPPSKTVTVFVSLITPAASARIEPQVPKKTALTPPQQAAARPETRAVVTKATPPVPKSSVPVAVPTEPAALAPPVKVPTAAPTAATPPSAPPVTSASAAVPPKPVTLGNELSLNCSERTPPVYPKQSMRLGEQGKTILQVDLDESGRVTAVAVKISSGYSRLDDAAISAVKSWHCTPARRNGTAVRSTALQPFNFALKGR